MRKIPKPGVSRRPQARVAANVPAIVDAIVPAPAAARSPEKRPEPVDIRAAHLAWLERMAAQNDYW